MKDSNPKAEQSFPAETTHRHKRIAVTGLRGIPGIMGGVETHCEELLPRLKALDPQIEITVFGRAPYLASGERVFRSIRVIPLPAPRRQSLEAIVSTLFGILEARRRGIRMIHIHAIGPGILAPFARALGLKVLVTHHGTDYDRAKWGFIARLILRAGEQASVRSAHGVICVAPSLTDQLRVRFTDAATRLHYIPNGAAGIGESDATKVDLLAQFGLEPKEYILAVGRLVPEKGFEYLIEAYRNSACAKKLVIVGAADHSSETSRDLLKEADDKVYLLGQQPRSVLTQLYHNAALFVLPSFHEGLPIVALEAAYANVPMLLSDIEANRSIGLPSHNYFPVGCVQALSEALGLPLEVYSIDSLKVRRQFDWDDIANRTLEVYKKVIG